MNQETTPAATEPDFDATAAFGQLMNGSASDSIQTASPARQGGDSLVNELRGDNPPTTPPVEPTGNTDGADEGSAGEIEESLIPPGVLEKVRRAQQDAGKAGERLGEERKARQAAEAQVAALESRLTALESGRQPEAQTQETRPEVLSSQHVEQFMSSLDEQYDSTKGEYITKEEAASIGVNAAYQALMAMRGEVGGVAGSIQQMRFDQELSAIGISRPEFDAIWQKPEFSWGSGLSDDQRLAALGSQARISGSGLSQPAGIPPQGGAPTTSLADPRRTIETNQSAGSAQNPRTLSSMRLNKALDAGDGLAAKQAAGPMFEALMRGAK